MNIVAVKKIINSFEFATIHKVARKGVAFKKHGLLFMYDLQGFRCYEDEIEYTFNEMQTYQLDMLLSLIPKFELLLGGKE